MLFAAHAKLPYRLFVLLRQKPWGFIRTIGEICKFLGINTEDRRRLRNPWGFIPKIGDVSEILGDS